MNDPRYTFSIAVSSHLIIENLENKILMGRRPDSWEWAPGRWGLVGGKVYENEKLEDSVKRKTMQELGFELVPAGLYQVKQLLIENRQVMMFFYTAKYSNQEIGGELAEYAWFDLKDLKDKPSKEFSEYFYKEMLTGYIEGDKSVFPVSKINSLDYVELGKTDEYKSWFEGIINKNYDPNKVPDFKKWEKNKTDQTTK